MRRTKMQKEIGITLIALIITIIVLLILAGVAIASVQDSGIIGKTKEAVEKHEAGKADEEGKLQGYEDFLESYMSGQQGGGDIVTPPAEGDDNVVVTPPVEDEGDGGENPPPTTDMPVATVGIKVEENSTINGEKNSSENPIIPAGFTAINTTTSSWDAENGPEVDNGLVIRDESGNEFVWVPVTVDIDINGYGVNTEENREPDVVTGVVPSETVNSASGTSLDANSGNLQSAGCTEDLNDDGTLNAYDFKIHLTKEYKVMAESVNKYDGFYVGRFETSMNGANPQSKRSAGKYDPGEIIVSATSALDSANTWYGLYALNKKYSTSSVEGSMMWGVQYDAMMTWMGDAANATITEYNKERTCGTAENDVIKNVYDLYGNSCEWTLEASYSRSRVYRGGYYRGSVSPSNRINLQPLNTDADYGSRLALSIIN